MSRLTTALIAVVLGVIAAGALFVIYDSLSAPTIIISPSTGLTEAALAINISGAVNAPGTYQLPAHARLTDAIAAAGGARADADLGSFNPARRIADEETIIIAALGSETATAPPAAGADGPAPASSDDRVNINAADATALDALPGIGPTIATRIIDYREANGPFGSVDELARVSGISSNMVDEMRDLITTGE